MNLKHFNSPSIIEKYIASLRSTSTSDSTISRKLSAIKSFSDYLKKRQIIVKPQPTPQTSLRGVLDAATPVPKFFNKYLIWTTIILILLGSAYGLYTQVFIRATKQLAYSTATNPIAGSRILSFQGRLTDTSGNPISSETGIIFKLYNNSIGGTQLYTSATGNSQTVLPDVNGIFNTVIGKSHGDTIPSNVFTENSEVWLEITTDSQVMTPRQQIATVAYALNAETLQGMPPSASGLKNTVLVVGESGNIYLGETSPSIISTSGTFGLEGQALLLKASDGSGGNITINPDGNGVIRFVTEGTTPSLGGFIDATNANIATGNLFNAQINNTNRGYNFIEFSNYNVGTTTTASRFSVSADGNVSIGGSITAASLPVGIGTSLIYIDSNGVLTRGISVGTTYAFTNGLTNSSNTISLGGTLTQNINFTVGNTSAFFINSTSGYVGIGTTNPLGKLHIANGLSGATPLSSYNDVVIEKNSNAGMTILSPDANYSRIVFGSPADVYAGLVTYSPTANELYFGTARVGGAVSIRTGDEADAMRILSSGNVGIGTTNPGKIIDISQNQNALSEVRITNTTAGTSAGSRFLAQGPDSNEFVNFAYIGTSFAAVPIYQDKALFQSGSTTSGMIFDDRSSSGFTFALSGSPKVSINSSGNVGIGTTNPTYALDVASSGLNGVSFKTSSGSFSYSGQQMNFNSAPTSPAASLYIYARNTGGGQIEMGTVGADPILFQTTNGTVTAMTIAGDGQVNVGSTLTSGNLYSLGNVGIGTTSPSYKLDIAGGSIRIEPNQSLFAENTAWGFKPKITSQTGGLGGTYGQQFFMPNDNNSNRWSWLLDTTEVMSLARASSSDTRLGIGTTAPTQRLDVSGSMNLTGTIFTAGTSGVTGQLLQSTGTGLQWVSASAVGGTYTATNGLTLAGSVFKFGGALTENTRLNIGNTEVLFLSTNGNVGIGTTNPTGKLGINAPDNTPALSIRQSNATAYGYDFTIDQNTGAGYIQGLNGAGPTNLMQFVRGSNYVNFSNSIVGIGISGLPSHKLQINSGNVAGDGLAIYGSNNPTLRLSLDATDTYSATLAYNNTTSNLDITPRSGFSTIFTSGNIGIGTTSPSKKLDVAGDINLTGTIFATGTSGSTGQVLS
ncbi:MAG: hypothetical protein WC069_00005, partial [Candidatus Shapirobacteria bacterium]